ncbi:MAG: hypothetical protein M3O50_19700, partial [Myxococcota bacterium]|nr:hypothetical protein [Myxococcota bacterium]
MSVLVDRALHDAGIAELLEARRAGPVPASRIESLRGADLLAIGALADRVRTLEVGDEVPIYMA